MLIKQKKEEKTKAGIILDGESVRTFPEGVIVALGDGELVRASNLKVDDKVHFNDMAGQPINDGDIEYIIIKLADILAKVC